MPGKPQEGEQFGSALGFITKATPDWDGEPVRYYLAIGAPGKTVNGHASAGKVYRLKRNHPTSDGWHGVSGFGQDSPNDGTGEPVGGHAETGGRFGTAPHYAREYVEDAGAVNGLYGACGGHEGAVGGTGGLVYGTRKRNAIDWRPEWTLFDGEGAPRQVRSRLRPRGQQLVIRAPGGCGSPCW